MLHVSTVPYVEELIIKKFDKNFEKFYFEWAGNFFLINFVIVFEVLLLFQEKILINPLLNHICRTSDRRKNIDNGVGC